MNSFLSKFIIKNIKTGNPSYTITMVVVGFFIINLKLLLSGIQITDRIKMSEFTGVDFATCIAALGSLHLGNKYTNNKMTKSEEEK